MLAAMLDFLCSDLRPHVTKNINEFMYITIAMYIYMGIVAHNNKIHK